MSDLPQHELAARARAAIAYAGREYKEFAELLHVDRTTMARKLGRKGDDRRSSLSDRDLAQIIEETGVPAWWFEAEAFSLLRPMTPEEIAEEAARQRAGRRLRDVASDAQSPTSHRGA